MHVIRDLASCPEKYKGSVLALGNFDGLHLGHRAIIEACKKKALSLGAFSAVMTFEPHPREFFDPGAERLRIYSFHQKMRFLQDLGIDIVFLVRFNRYFASLPAAAFVHDVLVDSLAVRHVVTGYNFAFGKDRLGTTAFLAAESVTCGFGYRACDPVKGDTGEVISSSAIRQLLAAGEIQKAGALLGRPYAIEGWVRHGQERGRKIGFPTANISLKNLFKPRFGVYAVRLFVEEKKTGYDAIANLGIRPTFGVSEPLLEVHAFGMDEVIYGKRVRIEFADFIRAEKRFDGMDLLRAQIETDCNNAKKILNSGRIT